MRGSSLETGGKRGYSFFLHKGALGQFQSLFYFNVNVLLLEAKHCPVSSECRKFIDKTVSYCHKQIIANCFDVQCTPVEKCHCCYPCIKSHADDDCLNCMEFLKTFLPAKTNLKLSKSVAAELKLALKELFHAVTMREVKVEDGLTVSVDSFIADFVKMIDEVKADSDIARMWHVKPDVASWVFSTLNEVLYGGEELSDKASSSDESEDFLDAESSSDDSEDFLDTTDDGLGHLSIYDD